MVRMTSDDIPVSLHATEEEALAAASALADDPGTALDLLEVEWAQSSLSHISVVCFDGGRPVRTDSVEFT
jgi:hypothetical protein